MGLPTGPAVTFLVTDIEGSAELLAKRDAMPPAEVVAHVEATPPPGSAAG